MFKTLINAWKIADLRKKMIYTLIILFIFRLGCAIPVPFLAISENGLTGANDNGTLLTYLSMMTGEAFNYGRIFALGITPYINSSIILQLLAVAIPALEKLSHDEEGRKTMAKITRYVTIALAVLQGIAYFIYINSQGMLDASVQTKGDKVFAGFVVVLMLTAGSALVMWLGEQINDKGIGNGISLILFAGIVSRVPTEMMSLYYTLDYHSGEAKYYIFAVLAIFSLIAMVVYICWMDAAERRIPVQYAKRVVGRKMYGGQSSNIPIKVNMSGVLPVIFASSILSLPPTIQMFAANKIAESKFWTSFFGWFSNTSPVYGCIYFVLIIFFAYFYASIQYNPVEMANNLTKNGGNIPGIRTGRPTAEYIAKVINKIVLLGALMLSVVALYPVIFSQITNTAKCVINVTVGGTSIIILVGVALETVQQIESQMMMRHYKGFLD